MDRQQYSIATADFDLRHHRENDESSTEVGDSLLSEEEKQWVDALDPESTARQRHRTVRTRARSVLRFLRSNCWLINMVLLLTVVVLLLLLRLEVWEPTSPWQIGGDYAGEGPLLKMRVMQWEPDESFVPPEPEEFLSKTTLARWNTLMPITDSEARTNETYYTTSVIHQVHCVYTMGRIYNNLVLGTTANLPDDYHAHFMHCLDYVRQAVMCGGDVAIESHEPFDSDDDEPLDDGWNGRHVCKDYRQVIQYLESQIEDGLRTVLPIDRFAFEDS